jgi:hypothetical protein
MPVRPSAMERITIDVVPGDADLPPRVGSPRRGLGLVAVALFVLGLWARGLPSFVAWEVARDHMRCFGRPHLPARIFSTDPDEVRDWLESRGTPTPPLPSHAHAAELVGARYCSLPDRMAAHVYYAGGGGGTVSVFVLAGTARVGEGWSGMALGLHVRLLRSAGRTLAVVGDSAADVAATTRAFLATVARAGAASAHEG